MAKKKNLCSKRKTTTEWEQKNLPKTKLSQKIKNRRIDKGISDAKPYAKENTFSDSESFRDSV